MSIKKDKKYRLAARFQEEQQFAHSFITKNEGLPKKNQFQAILHSRRWPRESYRGKISNRCILTGRSGGVYRAFRLSRFEFKRLASMGLLPGVQKSSW